MSKIPVLIAVDVIRGLKKAGFVLYRQAKGSHEIWCNPATKRNRSHESGTYVLSLLQLL